MLAWVIIVPLLFEDSVDVLFLWIILRYKTLKESVTSLKYFTSFNSSNMLFWSYEILFQLLEQKRLLTTC